MFANNRLPHALLFSGCAGIGKKAVARVLAAALLCQTPKDGSPCGKCQSCRLMISGTHPDFIEIFPEGKTLQSIKIDKIRAVKETASRTSVIADRRVIIIDDAHLMNEPAGNALLKTIEEPIGKINFILVTDSAGALLDTIISRCTMINFYPLKSDDVTQILTMLGFDSEPSQKLAAVAEGSVAKATELGENDGPAIYEDAVDFLSHIDDMPLDALFDKGEALSKLPKESLRDWLMHLNALLRDMLTLYVGGDTRSRCNERQRLVALLARYPKKRLFKMQFIVDDMLRKISANVNLRLFAESGVIKLRTR